MQNGLADTGWQTSARGTRSWQTQDAELADTPPPCFYGVFPKKGPSAREALPSPSLTVGSQSRVGRRLTHAQSLRCPQQPWGGTRLWGGWQGTPGHAEDPLPPAPQKLLAGADGERAPESEIGVGTLPKQKLNRAGGWRTQGQLRACGLRPCSWLPPACFTGGSGQGLTA